jgi:Flp pilus assembly protein TadD
MASAKINLAVINFLTGNAAQSVAALNEIGDEDIENAALRLKLAQAFALVGDCQKALLTVEKLDVKIKNNNALPLRAECYLQSGEREKATSLIPATKNLAKQNPAMAMKFADFFTRNALYKESADILRSVVASAPQNTDALIALAKSEIYLKDLTNAQIHLKLASKTNPNSPDLLFVESLLAGERGDTAQSLALLEKSLVANPDSTTVLSQLIITAMRANQGRKAFQAATKLLELKPDEPDFLYLHGAAALQSNNLTAAENSLNRFIEFRPRDARGCLALGLTFAAQADKLEVARRQFERCLETNPNNYEAKYQLGLSYKTQGETTRAVEYLEDAVKLSPDYAIALRDLGAVYLQSGAETKARVVLEKSVAVNPNDADTHFQLSRLYNLIGETALGKKHLETFQKLKNPGKNGM